jgi:hypothetical protein
MWPYVLSAVGPVAALAVALAIYVAERGPAVLVKWLDAIRELRRFRDGA